MCCDLKDKCHHGTQQHASNQPLNQIFGMPIEWRSRRKHKAIECKVTLTCKSWICQAAIILIYTNQFLATQYSESNDRWWVVMLLMGSCVDRPLAIRHDQANPARFCEQKIQINKPTSSRLSCCSLFFPRGFWLWLICKEYFKFQQRLRVELHLHSIIIIIWLAVAR